MTSGVGNFERSQSLFVLRSLIGAGPQEQGNGVFIATRRGKVQGVSSRIRARPSSRWGDIRP